MNNGYAGNILRVDLSTGDIYRIPTELYADRFIGGRGLSAKVYWDEVPSGIDAFDLENPLIFSTGPVCCVPGFAGSRWQLCSKSPIGNEFSYSNMGGAWGTQLKFAGYDALIVHGKADNLVYLFVDNDRVELRDASHLKGMGAIRTREQLKSDIGKSTRVVSIGPAGENRIRFASILADADSSGSGGVGAVMGSKNLKAIAVNGKDSIDVAEPERVRELRRHVSDLHTRIELERGLVPPDKLAKSICYGCIEGCIRNDYIAEDGTKGKFMCGSAMIGGLLRLDLSADKDILFKANKLCDDYGVDTYVIGTMATWLRRCNKTQILTEEESGLLFSNRTSIEYLQDLLEKISFRQGFGDVLAEGTVSAAKVLGNDSENLYSDFMTQAGQYDLAGPRLYNTTGLFYALEPKTKMPIQHLNAITGPVSLWLAREKGREDIYMDATLLRAISKQFWGSEVAADFSTYEGKALAAAKIQHREYTAESLILCHFSWPIVHSEATADHLGDSALESKVYSAITGNLVDEAEFEKMGERIFNMQRAVFIKDGHKGRQDDIIEERNYTIPLRAQQDNEDCIVPGKDGEPYSRKGMTVDREEFENLKNEYYDIRGWDIDTGFQKKDRMIELDLTDVAEELEKMKCLAS